MRGVSQLWFFQLPAFLIVAVVCAGQASAIEVTIDYTYDADNFFAPGSQARTAMQAAASYYSTILEDTFAEIDVPAKYFGSKGGEATWFWKRRFTNPQTGFTEAKVNPDKIGENKYIVYVGARDLANAGELGLAGPGGFVSGFVHRNGEFTTTEEAEINAIQATFADAVLDRGETSGFGRWGGSIAFDSETDWHFNHTTNPPVDTTPNDPSDDIHDFYSVALHELTHALGFGAEDDDSTNKTPWENLVSGTDFTGANAAASYTAAVNAPLASSSDTGHWKAGITSPVYEESGSQVALMVPSIPGGTRRLLTDIDAAALADIGWDILPAASASAASVVSLGNVNFSSGATSVAALSVSVVPEPASVLLISLAVALVTLGIRRR